MEINQTIKRIFDHLEADNIEGAVMACFRAARTAQDHLNTILFLRELYPSKEEAARTLYDDTSHLSDEAQQFIWKRSLDRWVELHTLDYALSPDEGDEDRKILQVAAGDIEPELRQWQIECEHLSPPSGMSAHDTAISHERSHQQRGRIRLRMMALQTLKSRLKTRCLNYAIQLEKQLDLQSKNQSILWEVQNDVNNFFKERDNGIFKKLQKSSQLAISAEPEDAALLLTEVRRVLRAVADYLYPPRNEAVRCTDGQERMLGPEQYMNRLEEFLAQRMGKSTAKDLAASELKLLAAFIRRLNELSSKGVHAEASRSEARQGLVGLYMFLSTVTQHATSEMQSSNQQ